MVLEWLEVIVFVKNVPSWEKSSQGSEQDAPPKNIHVTVCSGACESAVEADPGFLMVFCLGSVVQLCITTLFLCKLRTKFQSEGWENTELFRMRRSQALNRSSSFKVRRLLDSVWAHHLFLNPNLKSVRVSEIFEPCERVGLIRGKKYRQEKGEWMFVKNTKWHTLACWNAEWCKIPYSPLNHGHSVLASYYKYTPFPR